MSQFAWVAVDDASPILGDARPREISKLLKKDPFWHQLYRGWLLQNAQAPEDIQAFDFLASGGTADKAYTKSWMTQLDSYFDGFVTDVGTLKDALHDDPDAVRTSRAEHREAIDQGMSSRENQELTPVDTTNPMEDPDTMKMYVARSLGLNRNWNELSEQERMDALTLAAGESVGTASPGTQVQFQPGDLDPGTAGSTDVTTGIITISQTEFSAGHLDSETVNTMYHESEHVEQLAVARNFDPTQPRPLTQDQARAETMRYEIIDNLGDSNTPGTTMWAESGGTYEDYRALEIERQAHQAGDAAGRMYERVGAVHSELESVMAERRAQYDEAAEELNRQAEQRHSLGEQGEYEAETEE